MTREKDSSETNAKKGKGIIISALLTVEDSERLQKAFADGKLKDLGIIDLKISPTSEAESTHSQWTKKERRKKDKPRNEELE